MAGKAAGKQKKKNIQNQIPHEKKVSGDDFYQTMWTTLSNAWRYGGENKILKESSIKQAPILLYNKQYRINGLPWNSHDSEFSRTKIAMRHCIPSGKSHLPQIG